MEDKKFTNEELEYFQNKLKETMGKGLPKKYLETTELGDTDKEYKNLNDILSAHDVLDKLSFSEKKIKVFYTKDAPKDTTGNVMTMEDATLFAFEYAKRLLEKMNYSH